MTSKEAYDKIVAALKGVYDEGESQSIAAIVLEDGFQVRRNAVQSEKIFSPKETDKLLKIIHRLLKHEPVQYVLGMTVFYGLVFQVDKAVLIPRQETEELVAWMLEEIKTRIKINSNSSKIFRVLDIGTGSGCIPVTLKKELPELEMYALDVSREALGVAKKNAALNSTTIIFKELDILKEATWAELPVFDCIVSNPPYITEDEKEILGKNVLDYEPHLALFSGNNDAQRFIKKISAFAQSHLVENGCLFFETNAFHAQTSKMVMEENGLKKVEIRKDLNGNDRMLKGVKA